MPRRPSVDLALMGAVIVVWLLVALVWVAFMKMPEGARVWSLGALVFLVLFAIMAFSEYRGRGEQKL